MQAVIMAGGKGTRLYAITNNKIPKPMVPFCGKPLIERIIEWLVQYNIRDFVICIGYLGEQIKAYLSTTKLDVSIHYIEEQEPLGTAGALALATNYIREDFVFVYADLVFDIDLRRMVLFHQRKKAFGTIFVHPNSHPYDSDLVCCDDQRRVTGFRWKGTLLRGDYENIVNAGLMIFSNEIFKYIPSPRTMALERDLLSLLIQKKEPIYAYRSPEYIKDVGTVDRLAEAEDEFCRGKIEARNLRNKQKAIFLDRDGTVNQYNGLITHPDQIQLIDGASEAIRLINRSGYLAIIVTNQPVIARGDCTLEQLEEIHKRLFTLLGNSGAYVDDLIFCPHHPDRGYPGENETYKVSCSCRKPKTGMIKEMARKYNIDLNQSWMIGDTLRDIQTGINAGTRTALVHSPATEIDAESLTDLKCNDLLSIVKTILLLDEHGDNNEV